MLARASRLRGGARAGLSAGWISRTGGGTINIQSDTSPEHGSEVQGSASPRQTRVIAVVNQKGGVGKTTSAVNLAACFGASERSTLLIDLDPQGNASSAYGITNPEVQIYDALIGERPIKDVSFSTQLDYLQVVPAGSDLVGAEIELVTSEERASHLAAVIEEVRGSYDIILIDCPPSLGILTLNALTAADSVLIPLQCEYYALEGLARLMETTELVRRELNPGLEIEGIVLTMVDMRNNLSRQVEAEVRSHFADKVYRTRIPRNVRLSEAPSHGEPILLYDVHSKGSIAYLKLAEEIVERIARESKSSASPRPELERDTTVENGSAGGIHE